MNEARINQHPATAVGVYVSGGPLGAAGTPGPAKVDIFGGNSGSEQLAYQVANDASLLVEDCWYEDDDGNEPQFVDLTGSGNVTLQSDQTAVTYNSSVPAFNVNGFTGNFSMLGVSFMGQLAVQSNCTANANLLALGNTFGPYTSSGSYVVDNSASAQYALVGNREPTDSTGDTAPVPAQGNADNNSFILAMLAQARTDIYTPVTPLDYGVTDVRFYGVVACGGQYGMEIQGIVAPTAPTGLQATPTSNGPVNLAWTAAKGDQVGYNIYRGTTLGGENATPLNGGAPIVTTSYADATAVAGTTYYYIVKAVNAAGSSGASNEYSTLTFPGAPTSLGATAVLGSQVSLSWTVPSGTVSGYNIYRGTTPGGENYSTPLNGGTLVATASYNDTTAIANTTYYYTVVAVNASGSSAASNEASGPQTFYWTGSAGVWSVGGGGWLSAGGQAVNWSDGNIAVFDGTSGGAVTISGTVTPQQIDFETDGYSLSGGSIVLPLVGGIVRVDADSATIAATISGGALAESGSGSLVVAGSSGYYGGTTVEGTLSVSSAQALPSAGVLVVGRSGRVVLGNSLGSASLAASSPVASSNATTPSIAATSVEISAPVTVATTDETVTPVSAPQSSATHDAVFTEPQAVPMAAVSMPSEPTEAVRVAALSGVVLPSASLSETAARKALLLLPAKVTLVSGISMATQHKIAALINTVPALPLPSGVVTIVAPAPGASLGPATAGHRGRSALTPGKSPRAFVLARAPNGPSHHETDESSAGA